MNHVHENKTSMLSTNPSGWIAPAISPSVQSTTIVPRINRILQKVASVFAHRMSRAVSGVAMRLLQVSRDRSAIIPSAPKASGDSVRRTRRKRP